MRNQGSSLALTILFFQTLFASNVTVAQQISEVLFENKPSDSHGKHEHEHEHEHVERVIVQATRTGRIADEEPVRVEVINREEIQEKAAMRPGNISMLVAETGGVRVQTTSPALGSANIRLQGLYGRYTQLLADGLPLYGNQAASIGLLQIPPTDLGRVEIIKGSASSLYGGSALGGVINLVSRRPGETAKAETVLNATSRDGQDVTAYVEMPLTQTARGSITAGAHHQKKEDVDGDGWADLAGYERYTVRPRLFWEGESGRQVYFTGGYMNEHRQGGTMPGEVLSNNSPFEQDQHSSRLDSGLTVSVPVGDVLTFSTRASAMKQQHTHVFGINEERDEHESYLFESSFSGYTDNSNWVAGLAYQSEVFTSKDYPLFDYRYEVPGVFAQIDYEVSSALTTSFSGRIDDHNEYGTQFSPRVSLLYRYDDFTLRTSYGQGYFAPTPFVEEIEAAGLSRLDPAFDLDEEQAETASIDLTYRFDSVETSLTFFGSNVKNVTKLEAYSSDGGNPLDGVRLYNADGETQIRGSELLLRYYWRDLKVTGSYLYLDTDSADEAGSLPIALTPQHSAGFVAMWERHGEFRAGFEAYYTGTQRVENNPYISQTKPYWHLGLMGEITRGPVSWFINLENLLDVKQTDTHPMLLPQRAPSGQWTTDIWSRNDGFIVNAGVRLTWGA